LIHTHRHALFHRQAIHGQLSLSACRDLFDLVNQEPGWLYEGNGVLHPRGPNYDDAVRRGMARPLVQKIALPRLLRHGFRFRRIPALLTAVNPAEYGRKLGGIVESPPTKFPSRLAREISLPSGGSFDQTGWLPLRFPCHAKKSGYSVAVPALAFRQVPTAGYQ